jgi:hypothetical protein
LADVAQAMLAVDNSYTIDLPLELGVALDGGAAEVVGKAAPSGFSDSSTFIDGRATGPIGPP